MQSKSGLCIAFEHHVFLYTTCAEEITAENVLGYILHGSVLSSLKRNSLKFSLKVNLLCPFILTHKTCGV